MLNCPTACGTSLVGSAFSSGREESEAPAAASTVLLTICPYSIFWPGLSIRITPDAVFSFTDRTSISPTSILSMSSTSPVLGCFITFLEHNKSLANLSPGKLAEVYCNDIVFSPFHNITLQREITDDHFSHFCDKLFQP